VKRDAPLDPILRVVPDDDDRRDDDDDRRDDDDDIAARLHVAEREITAAFHELVARRRAKTGVSGETPARSTVELRLELPAAGTVAAGAALPGQLVDQVRRAAETLADQSAVFPSGRVHCYWCRSFDCEHSSAPDCRHVFHGYSATGQPLWSELTSVLLERRDPRVDLLYEEPPATITIVQSGDELAAAQLPIYGRDSGVYRVLGQLVVGYLSTPAGHARSSSGHGQASGRARSAWAITLHAVQGSPSAGVLLNVIGRLPDGTPAFEAIEEAADARLADALWNGRRRLAEIPLDAVPRRRRCRERKRLVLDSLRRLSSNLERIFRQRTRRTRHSEDRRSNKQRPLSTALSDALAAKDGAFYRDVEERTWVVVGPKNRVHVFNDGGLHVTSVSYPGETVRHRTTRGKWLRPCIEEIAAFRDALAVRSGAQREAPPSATA